MPTQSRQFAKPLRRLLWLLVGGVVLLGILSLVASSILRNKLEHWLTERGLETQIDYLQVSIPRLSVVALGIRAQNRDGRGFHARELLLDYSWWQLLRGRLQIQKVALDGAYMDLESATSEHGRLWEVGGWALGHGERRDRDLRLLFERVQIRDSQLCYRHRPQWPTQSCVSFGDLRARDLLIAMQRQGDVPLALQIGAARLQLQDLLMRPAEERPNTALVSLDLSDGLYTRSGHRITAKEVSVTRFASCPPERWVAALPALRRLVGHCGSAGQLQLAGDLLFSFGRGAEVRWHRANGQNIALRYRNQRWQNWRAQSLAIADFDFLRDARRLTWQRAGASAFDWCPGGIRNRDHHYCVRAGTLQLKDPVTFDWSEKLKVTAGPSRLQQTQLLDLAGANRNPVTVHQALLGTLEYGGKNRTLEIEGVELESASGCIPGSLWQQMDYCVRLVGLHSAESLQLRFLSRLQNQSWGFASGPLKLAEFRATRDDHTQLQLQKLHWQRIDLQGSPGASAAPLLVQDFGLQSLSGCLPDALLPRQWRPLCADLSTLVGSGNFAWQGGEEGYVILGELRAERLLLADRLNGAKGLLLQQLHTGEGYMRRDADGDNPWIDADPNAVPTVPVSGSPPVPAEVVDEKGLLSEERAQAQKNAPSASGKESRIADIASPNLSLQSASLSRLQGCLPETWARLLYKQPQQMPGCFDLRNLRQHSPLVIAWQGGLDLAAGQLTLERAVAKTPREQTLLDLSALRLPNVRIRYLPQLQHSVFWSLPNFSLKSLYACLPGTVQSPALDIRCAELQELQMGKKFNLTFDSRELQADLSGTLAQRILLLGQDEQSIADIQKLLAPQLEIFWSRRADKSSRIKFDNLSIASVHACLPENKKLRAGLPRCISSSELHSVGESGLRFGQTLFKASPVAPPLWSIEALSVNRFSLSPDTLDLHGLDIQQILFCGIHDLLPGGARESGIADCITAKELDFSGVSHIGLTPSVARLELGELESQPIATWQETGEYLQAGFQRLSWKKLRWNGEPALWVSDLAVDGFRGCAPQPVMRVTIELLEDITDREAGSCYGVKELHLRGTQKLSLAAPYSTDGSLDLVGIHIGRGADKPVVIEHMQLDQIAYGGVPIGHLSGASGCLAAGVLGDSRLAPCYRFGEVAVQRFDRVDSPTGRATILHGLKIAGVQLQQRDYLGKLPAQLLQLEHVAAERLRVGGGAIDAQQLEVRGASSCIPEGYIVDINHCISIDELQTSGSYVTGEKHLALTKLQLQNIQLLSSDGRQLVKGGSVAIEGLSSNRDQFSFDWAEAADFEFFSRRKGAPEYHRHSVIGRLAGLRVEQLGYDRIRRRLEIANVDALRPRLLLMRNRAGEYPILKEVAALTGAPQGRAAPVAESAPAAEQRFRYHIQDLDVRYGTFTWVDRRGQYRASLPIRAIYLTVHDISNEPDVPPMVVLLNGRPGGFGEIQLAGTIEYLDTHKWNADLTGYIVNTSLIPAGPYMAELLGYKILQGQLDAKFDIRVRENKLKANADMRLEKIKVRRVRDEDQLKVEQTFIPLNIALLLMKDGKGNVYFSMPVSGELYDPKFSFSFVFSDLLQNAIMTALFGYFTPLGLYTLSKFAWARFRAVRFDPIIFAPGSAELSAKAQHQLREVIEVLRERPDARPGICGIANARDWHALYPNSTPGLGGTRKARESFYRYPPLNLYEEFERLALERSRKVESFLLDAGITAAEIIPCAPDYNGRDFDKPRVEFSR
ncbi:DUF748 domain-containing protein [Microbulbifer hainanensis]|uniref:DUF748 domain-containing protein n=1 Tax=Microbulbifer hainanensis TaxID=2735675 RepID=UPI0018677745|nr:DUF748 domain-containing protein [Microbulbifer hainanensis]